MKKNIIEMILVYLGVLFCGFAVMLFNRCLLMELSLTARILCMPVIYWLYALVPLIVMVCRRYHPADLGFSKQNLLRQIAVGIAAALVMSLLLTLLPHMLGFGEWVDNGYRLRQLWQYLYYFLYDIIAVGAVEEIIFRGYFYHGFLRAGFKEWIAVIGSSVLFGFLHIYTGNLLQVFMTALLGLLFCMLRLKLKNCTLLSLILVHGIYDFLIVVWSSLLLQ